MKDPAQRLAYSIDQLKDNVPAGRTSIYAAIARGDLVARKLGRRTVVLDEDARRWLQQLPRFGEHDAASD